VRWYDTHTLQSVRCVWISNSTAIVVYIEDSFTGHSSHIRTVLQVITNQDCFTGHLSQFYRSHLAYTGLMRTEWRRLIGCLQFQVIFHKRATNYSALLREITYEDKASKVLLGHMVQGWQRQTGCRAFCCCHLYMVQGGKGTQDAGPFAHLHMVQGGKDPQEISKRPC